MDEPPPVGAWDAISSRMDVSDVWTGVDSKLTAIDTRKKYVRRISYSLLLLLLITVSGTLLIYYGGESEKVLIVNSDNTNTSEQKELVGQNSSVLSSVENTGTSNTSTAKNNSSVNSGAKTVPVPPTNSAKGKYDNRGHATLTKVPSNVDSNDFEPAIASNQAPLAKENNSPQVDTLFFSSPLPVSLFTLQNRDYSFGLVLALDTALGNYLPQANPENPFSGFYFGANCMVKNTWLLNSTTYNGLSSKSLAQTNLHFGNAYGISAGYYITPKWSTEINWYVNSQQGQTYHVYNEGQYVQEQIKLDFTAFNLSIKQNSSSRFLRKNVRTSHGVIAGINLAYLKKGDDGSDSGSDENYSDYSDFDYGLRLGYEYNFLISGHVLFSPAIMGDFGIKNIYRGNASMPGSFNQTRSASFGLSLGIKYLIPKKT